MQANFKDIAFLFPEEFKEEDFLKQRASVPFNDEVIDFLSALSKELTKDVAIKAYPDVATFGFFCRKASISVLKKKHGFENQLRLGRGILFHIAPSNVPVNFAYSFVAGLLAGNVNIVRVPSKNFDQVSIIINAIKRLANSGMYKAVLNKTAFVRYDRQSIATKYLSSLCDVRVIWGGDETIAQIRKESIPARAYDVTFADRYSLTAINADEYINENNVSKIALGFYNDTYLFDQNACTAPHLVVWTGKEENVIQAKEIFWNSLQKLVDEKYSIQSVMAVDKLSTFYEQAIKSDRLQKSKTKDNSLWRVDLNKLQSDIDEFRCAGGYFSEYHAVSLDEIESIINRKYQTLAYYGFTKEELSSLFTVLQPSGIDRVVPIGRTTDFSLIWDGFDLINSLSRTLTIL